MKIIIFILFFVLCISTDLPSQKVNVDSLRDRLYLMIEKEPESKQIDSLMNYIFNYHSFKSPKEGIEFNLDIYRYAVINELNDLKDLVGTNIGMYYRELGIYNVALDYFLESISYREKIGDVESRAWILINIGNIYFDQDDFAQAIEYYRLSIGLFQKLEISKTNKNALASNYDGIAVNYNNIGLCYRQLEDLDESIKYHKKAVDFRIKADNIGGIAHAYRYIGRIFKEKDILDSALYYYETASQFYRLDLNTPTMMFGYNALYLSELYIDFAELYIDNDLQQAENYLDSSKIYIVENDLKTTYITHQITSLKLLNYKKQQSKFDKKLNKLIDFIYENNLGDKLNLVYELAYNINKNNDRKDSALKYLELFNTYQDSILKRITKGSIIGIEQKIELEMKSNELQKIAVEKKLDEIKLADQRKFISILIISLILLTGIVGIYFYLNDFKKKTNKMLVEKNEELNISKSELEELNTTKDKFFSIIAHDLRNPIGAVRNISEILVSNYNDFDDQEKREFIEEMAKSLSSISKLLENLLTWSRSQRGIIHYYPEEFNLNLLVNNNIKIFENWAQDKKIKLINSVDTSLQIYADTEMINTVLRNLISNGIKYTQENGYVKISAIRLQESIEISVQDNGIGIPENVKNTLFSTSSSGSRIGTKNEQGTGLGLILSKEFVEKHDGKIDLESAEYKGSRFYFTVPIKNNIPQRL